MPIKLNKSLDGITSMTAALKGGSEEQFADAMQAFAQGVADDTAAQYAAAVASNDQRIMAERGFRALTSEETAYYQRIIDALKSDAPKQAFADIPDKAMPTTIFDQVLKDIEENHPLIAAINPINVGYITEWVRNKHTRQLAAWGNINEAITKEIASAFEVIDVKQGKVSAFAVVSRDMLDLGPTWLDGYVRTVLGEALACAMEYGIVAGKGVGGEPVGMIRDIHDGVSINSSTGYPEKAAIKMTSLDVTSYGAAVANLAKTEAGKDKPLDLVNGGSLALICNVNTYLTKVLPAVRVLGVDGVYRDSYPVATKTLTCSAVDDNKAVLALLDEYGLFVGTSRGIEVSDEAKFLEDQRAFKIVGHAYGQCEDNNSAVVLDLSGLEATTPAVKVKGTVSTKAQA